MNIVHAWILDPVFPLALCYDASLRYAVQQTDIPQLQSVQSH